MVTAVAFALRARGRWQSHQP